MTDANAIIIEPVPEVGNGRWRPAIGQEALGFINHSVPEAAREDVCAAAVTILGKGIPPTEPAGQQTGLVVGYVQSGKTMSFETVTALARDNGFQIAIVVTGTSNPLFNQSSGRLRRDLRLDDPRRERRWIHFPNPSNEDAIIAPIRDVLEEWRDAATPEEYKRTVLITVLKNHRRLQNLAELLRRLDLRGVP